MKTKLIVDLSKWDTRVNYQEFKDADLLAAIARAGGSGVDDRQARVHGAGVRMVGLALGLYYWVDPTRDGKQQATHFRRLISEIKPDFLALDVEQWWASWDLWYAWMFGKLEKHKVPVVSARQINRVTRDFYEACPAELKKLIYTRISFLVQYCKELIPFVAQHDCWLAQWPCTGGDLKKRTLTWDELKEKYLPTTKPAKLVDMDEVTLWQWTGDRFTLPGTGRRTDVNLWTSERPFELWLNKDIPSPSAPPYREARLAKNVYGLNVREAPWITVTPPSILRVILPKDVVRIDPYVQRVGKWVKLWGEVGWCNDSYLAYF